MNPPEFNTYNCVAIKEICTRFPSLEILRLTHTEHPPVGTSLTRSHPPTHYNMTTQSQLQSLVSGVNTVDDMTDYMYPALFYQYMFQRKTSPWEMADWDYDELQKFKVELENVDRLYYIQSENDAAGSTFHLLARVKHKKKTRDGIIEISLFVELTASCDYTGFDCQGEGDIFVTANPNIFYQVILRDDYNRANVYSSLVNDGYCIDDHTGYHNRRGFGSTTAPMLKFLCHQAINDNKDQLKHHYPNVLPKILKESVDEFINIKESINVYDYLDDMSTNTESYQVTNSLECRVTGHGRTL